MDPNEQSAARYRLFARAIKVAGVSHIATLQPLLQASLEKTVEEAMDSHEAVDGKCRVVGLAFRDTHDSQAGPL